jgi:hydrocephalus-inducing protein
LGTKVTNTKRFYVVNPTSLAYDYEWKKMEAKTPVPTSKDTILSVKKAEMIFESTRDLLGTHESSWIFEIPT